LQAAVQVVVRQYAVAVVALVVCFSILLSL
jgi:hypothetical protein